MPNTTRHAIIDATVTQTEARFRGLAAKYVQWELETAGAAITANPRDADVVLVSVVSPHEYMCVPRALKRAGIKPLRHERTGQRVVLGGQGAMSPAAFDPYIDAACVGEGRTFLRTMLRDGLDAAMRLPNAWIPGDTRPVIPDDEFPWDAPPTMAEDGIVRVYASRGCKKKCLFCHTGWSITYRENDEETLLRQHKALVEAGYRVNVVTNDAPALSFFGELKGMEHFSASYSQTRQILDTGDIGAFAGVKSVRFGVEAPSSRLRAWVGKPIETGALFDVSCRLLNSGVGVRWFLIAGLPGETDEDYEELRDVVLKARHHITKGALQLSFTAFCPDAAAPLCIAPLDDTYWDRFQSFWKWFFEGVGYTRKIMLMRCAGPTNRLKHALGSMGCTEADLRTGWLEKDPPNWRVRYAYLTSARRAYNVYARRCGLPMCVETISSPAEPKQRKGGAI